MTNDTVRVPDGTGLSQAEPSSTVSALTGFDPSREDTDTYEIQMDASRRLGALTKAADASSALHWLRNHARRTFAGSTSGEGWSGYGDAQPYMKAAQEDLARELADYAIKLAVADLEAGYASAIEARRAETENTGSVHESAVAKPDAPTGAA